MKPGMSEPPASKERLMAHTLCIVSHTHWDREWYLPFQEFRIRLVQLMDKLLYILAHDVEYPHFTLDGQTILLEDYLAIRPERRKELERYVREHRILIGPWYVLADEFLVSPEALIRNLMVGHRRAREFGAVMEVGYTPDSFGHIGQLPQILRGFGIESAILQRGLGDENTELCWQAPDGSEVLLIYLRDGYYNAAHLPVSDHKRLLKKVKSLKQSLMPHASTEYLLLMNGVDHMEPQPELPKALERLKGELADDRIIHGTLPSYVRMVRQALADKPLPTIRGELRSPRRHHLLPGVLSSRIQLKQRNQACQNLLEKWAEPFAAFAQLVQPSASKLNALVKRSWLCLLENHPHDSICGCSIDQVHREMMTRFDWSEQIAEAVTRESLEVVASNVATSSTSERDRRAIPVVVFNPLGWPRTDVVELDAQLPQRMESFFIEDAEGVRAPHQVSAEGQKSNLIFLAQDVPGHGYRTYFVKPSKERQAKRTRTESGIENERYRIQADRSDGTVTVVDAVTGTVLAGLNGFVDGGDRGDEYNYCAPADDLLVSTPIRPPDITVVETGPVRHTLEVGSSYSLPMCLTEDRTRRRDDTIEMPIISRITLCPHVQRIEIRTTLTNRARDHRLRVHFPIPWRVESSFAESAFDVVERPVALPSDTAAWAEQPAPTHPQAMFVDLSDGQRGLMMANRGLPEYEAFYEDKGTTLALTLLRCVGWLSRDDLSCRRGHAGPGLETPEAQCLETYSFDYALIPHAGDWRAAFREAHAFNAPLRGIVTDMHSGTLPLQNSFIRTGPSGLVVSAIKAPEEGEGLIVRLCNTEDHEVPAEVCLHKAVDRASLVNLNEEELRRLTVNNEGGVSLPVPGEGIVTVRLEFDN